MAPPRALLPQRMMSCDFLGVNWTKVMWMAPYSNFYPLTMTAGQQGRMWSSFLHYGNKEHRMSRMHVRNMVLGFPTAVMALCMLLQSDWYQNMVMLHFCIMQPVPEWIEEKHAEDCARWAYHKPGVTLKHKWGGQVSIPGSEKNPGLGE